MRNWTTEQRAIAHNKRTYEYWAAFLWVVLRLLQLSCCVVCVCVCVLKPNRTKAMSEKRSIFRVEKLKYFIHMHNITLSLRDWEKRRNKKTWYFLLLFESKCLSAVYNWIYSRSFTRLHLRKNHTQYFPYSVPSVIHQLDHSNGNRLENPFMHNGHISFDMVHQIAEKSTAQ